MLRHRFSVAIVAAGLLGGVAGCRVVPGTADSDTELRGELNRGLDSQVRGRSFLMRDALPDEWTRMWFFFGYTPRSVIEHTVGLPWDGAPDEVPEAEVAVVVRGPGERVRGFMWDTDRIVFTTCLPNGPVTPDDPFVLLGPVPQEDADSNLLARARPASRRSCSRELVPAASNGS